MREERCVIDYGEAVVVQHIRNQFLGQLRNLIAGKPPVIQDI